MNSRRVDKNASKSDTMLGSPSQVRVIETDLVNLYTYGGVKSNKGGRTPSTTTVFQKLDSRSQVTTQQKIREGDTNEEAKIDASTSQRSSRRNASNDSKNRSKTSIATVKKKKSDGKSKQTEPEITETLGSPGQLYADGPDDREKDAASSIRKVQQ